jgi:DNA-directed RNA polymerase subunit N (RpoN/RPB10)
MTNWDSYSNQPHIIKDKSKKREIYKKSLFSHLKLLFFNILIFPFIFLAYILKLFHHDKSNHDTKDIFCMSINLENSIENEKELLDELGVKRILIRFPMWEMDRIEKYKEYIESFSEYEVLINLMQSRTHIEDHQLLKEDIKKIFESFKSVREFQVGTTINRKKWEFYSVDEYLKFFEVVKSVRDESFCDKVLIGSSVIDFEYHFSLRSLFNFYKVYYDRFSTLLYVDRRGSPFNTQAGFDLYKKIELLWTMVKLSPKSADTIYITETNWPIKETAPYAPTSEKECVSLEEYADFMVAYHLIALASRKV